MKDNTQASIRLLLGISIDNIIFLLWKKYWAKMTDRQTYIVMHDDRERHVQVDRVLDWQMMTVWYLSNSRELLDISSDALGACIPKLADPYSRPLCTWFKNSPSCCKISGSSTNTTKDVLAITSGTCTGQRRAGHQKVPFFPNRLIWFVPCFLWRLHDGRDARLILLDDV